LRQSSADGDDSSRFRSRQEVVVMHERTVLVLCPPNAAKNVLAVAALEQPARAFVDSLRVGRE
jgi:hypothetical protein